MEEVFDQATRLALRDLMSKGEISELNGVVSAGKEGRVYYGVTGKGDPRAVKIYMVASADFKKRLVYISGDRRFGKIPGSSTEIIKLWVRKEFKNLQLAHSKGVRVPRPYSFLRNVIVMEYIGEPPAPAPTMAEAEVDPSDYKWVFSSISKLYRSAELVHADLSEYNIFKWGDERVIFDMGSAVTNSHPQAATFLRRDIANMVRFFRKRGIFEREAEDWFGEITK
jgi:RIO kinase 1